MKKYINNQEGRSMIEMLGVLAIVGVLSVAGIQGYSKAMGKYKANKAMDQISTLAANIKTMFASLGTYGGLTGVERAYNLGLLPDDMIKTCGTTYSANCVKNAFNGAVAVGGRTPANETAATEFSISFGGLTKDACTAIVTSDWGNASGFSGILVTTEQDVEGENGQTTTQNVESYLSGSVSSALEACGAADGENAVTLVFK